MKKIANAILAAFEMGKGLSGMKTLISLALIFIGKNLDATNEALAILPDAGFLESLKGMLELGLFWVGKGLVIAGGAWLPFGVLDKFKKFLVALKG